MSFSTKKCTLVLLGNVKSDLPETNYYFCRDHLQKVECCKYLGVMLHQNLKWETHVNMVIGKAFRVLGLIKHTLFNAPRKVKFVAYVSLCRPIVEYAAEVWDPYMVKDIHSIEMVQNSAMMRFILNIKGLHV